MVSTLSDVKRQTPLVFRSAVKFHSQRMDSGNMTMNIVSERKSNTVLTGFVGNGSRITRSDAAKAFNAAYGSQCSESTLPKPLNASAGSYGWAASLIASRYSASAGASVSMAAQALAN
jgi:hypothetical protein